MQELGSTSEREGGGRGHGYGERRSQVRSVTRGRENRGGGGGPERERGGAGGEGGSVASRGSRGGCHGEAGGGGLRVRACVRCPSSWQRRKKTRGEEEVGWAGSSGLGCWWATR